MTVAASIQDYALIGDGRSAALVSRGGSIDWLCWPCFDSEALFAALLDPAAGGHFRIAPTAPARVQRRYVEGTAVLETRFCTAGGTLVLTDFMPVSPEGCARRLCPESELQREVACEAGEVEVEVHYAPRPGWGRRRARLRDAGGLGLRLEWGAHLLTLRGEVALERRGPLEAGARFVLREGERAVFSLSWADEGPAVLPALGALAASKRRRTESFWRAWTRRCRYAGPHREAVQKSVLVLKLLCFAPSGALVAAPTTSLPERPGGDLNWDYRYCWLRDAAFSARALLGLGYEEEAGAFVSWLLHATRLTWPQLRVLYDVYGRPPQRERELGHLGGHGGARPVRVGNAAARQVQLDVYGAVADAVAQRVRAGERLDGETQRLLRGLGTWVCRHWQQPDEGIWEPRGGPRAFTHSRVLCWTALTRLLELHRRGALEGVPVEDFERQCALIRQEVETRGYSRSLGSYTQQLEGDSVDASLLQLAWYGFADPHSPRMRGTCRRLLERLQPRPGLLYRYEESPRVGEGAFGLCGFWLAEYLARGGGSLEQARTAFEDVLPFANDVGLYGEEIHPDTGEALGNFPQAFTHVGLVNAALTLERRERREGRAAVRTGEAPRPAPPPDSPAPHAGGER